LFLSSQIFILKRNNGLAVEFRQAERTIMQHTLPSEDIRPIKPLGNQTAKLLKDVQRNRRPVFLINKGKAAGVLMDIEEYERLLELIDLHETILASEAEADRGEVIPHEQLEKESRNWIKKANSRKNTKSNGQKRRDGR
jgi:prevent-host-death family protein